MSIGPLGGLGASAAGGPLSQTKGTETERAAQDTTSQQRQVNSEKSADSAAGVGQTAEDQQSSDRDADGHRLWEQNQQDDQAQQAEADNVPDSTQLPQQIKDLHGISGNELDLLG